MDPSLLCIFFSFLGKQTALKRDLVTGYHLGDLSFHPVSSTGCSLHYLSLLSTNHVPTGLISELILGL